MKILHMISGGDSGGAKTHVFALLDKLRKLCDVKIVCFTDGVFYKDILKTEIPSVLMLQKGRSDMSVVDKLAHMITDEEYDIVHAHGARANFIANSLKKRITCPVVTTVHSDYMLDFDELYKKVVFTLLNMYSLSRLDYYIAVSDTFKKMLIGRGYEPNRIFTVYNGMDYQKPVDYMDKQAFAERCGIQYDENKTYVGIIGRFDKVKGHEVFLKAACLCAKKNKNIEFLLAGDGPEKENLVRICREGNISDRVHFLGFINDIYSFINFIDINTLTSHSESFPYVLLEGARFSKPTIASHVGGIPDLIINGETGYTFTPGDAYELSEYILKLADDKALTSKLGNALYLHATNNFSSDALARRHIEIYESIMQYHKDKYNYDAVLSGYYGFKNSGDDALLYALVKDKERIIKNARFSVLSGDPKSTRADYCVDATGRYNIFRVISTMKKAKLLISGGGSLIQDTTSNKSLYYYLFIIALAKRLGLKTMVYANGIGPINNKKNEKIVRRVLDGVDVITLRDEDSVKELSRLGVTNKNIHLTSDPALTLSPAPDSVTERTLYELGIRGKYVVISVRSWKGAHPDFLASVAMSADYMYTKYGLIPVFAPMQYPCDYTLARRIQKLMTQNSYILPRLGVTEQIGIIKRAYGVIGMRLHTLIYAVSTAVPTIAISYDPKVTGLMNYMGSSLCVDVKTFTEKELCACIDTLTQDYEKLFTHAKTCADRLVSLAHQNTEFAHSLIADTPDE